MNHQSVKPAVLLDIGIDFFSQVLEVGRCQGAHWRNNQDTLVLEQLTLNHIRHSAVVEGDIYRLLSIRGTYNGFRQGQMFLIRKRHMFLQKVLRAGLALMLLGALTTLSPAVVSTARSQSAQQAGSVPKPSMH